MDDSAEVAQSSVNLSLSIVIPFYNSQHNSTRLLRTLGEVDHPGVEVICVDDGSTDETDRVLREFADTSKTAVTIINQDNSGPGSARNAGLRQARGEYVWFIDCDDDVRKETIDHFEAIRHRGFDFIDFNLEVVGVGAQDGMSLPEGEYEVTTELRTRLVGSYGSICTKIIKRDLLIENEIRYPEQCFYEDNVFGFIMPFYVNHFYKSELAGYLQHVDFESVTRQKLNPRYFDRLHTPAWGFAAGRSLTVDQAELKALEDRLIDLFLIKTTKQIFRALAPKTGFMKSLRQGRLVEATAKLGAHVASLWFVKSWLLSARVHRYYREVANELGITRDPFECLTNDDRASRAPWRCIWASSFFMTSQRKHFDLIRVNAWDLDGGHLQTWSRPKRPSTAMKF